MMQTTPNRSTPFFLTRSFGRLAIVAVALVGLSFTSSAEAGRRDRSGYREVRQVQLVISRVQRLELVSARAIDQAPDATVRLLNLLVTRGAGDSDLEGIALRGSHKVAVQRRKFEDQVRKYTDGVIQSAVTTVVDEDGNTVLPEIDQIVEGTVTFLRNDRVSEDLIIQVMQARQSALNAIQDAALVAEARINAALEDALAAP